MDTGPAPLFVEAQLASTTREPCQVTSTQKTESKVCLLFHGMSQIQKNTNARCSVVQTVHST